MKLNPDLSPLSNLRKRIGLNLSDWTLPKEGIDVPVPIDVNVLENIEIMDGIITYKNRKSVIYIKDHRQDQEKLENDIRAYNRFHFMECYTIKTMRKYGRFERYVLISREDGIFSVVITDYKTKKSEEKFVRLLACKYCLKQFGRINYYKEEDWFKITPKIIYKNITPTFLKNPTHTHTSYPSGSYNKDWNKTSKKKKESVNFKCEYCNVNLTNHKNGVVNSDLPENLVALCIVCHSEQPYHQRLKVSDEDKRIINSLRIGM